MTLIGMVEILEIHFSIMNLKLMHKGLNNE
jgi:hypothetical protein